MLMEDTHYLPEEELKEANYPEVGLVREDLKLIDSFAMELNTAVTRYNEGEAPQIFVEVSDLRKAIERCRNVLNILGKANNPCFDLIVDIRNIQEAFHEVYYAYKRYGDQYLGSWENFIRGEEA